MDQFQTGLLGSFSEDPDISRSGSGAFVSDRPPTGPTPPDWLPKAVPSYGLLGNFQSPNQSMNIPEQKSGNNIPEKLSGDIRQQQAQFQKIQNDLSIRNSYLAAPIVAPFAMMFAPEEAEAFIGNLMARGASQALKGPLNFIDRDRFPRTGTFFENRVGNAAHADLRATIDQKPGWEYGSKIDDSNGTFIRPDVKTPRDFYMELKPETRSGRKAAAQAVQRYGNITGRPTRSIFYDPEDYDPYGKNEADFLSEGHRRAPAKDRLREIRIT